MRCQSRLLQSAYWQPIDVGTLGMERRGAGGRMVVMIQASLGDGIIQLWCDIQCPSPTDLVYLDGKVEFGYVAGGVSGLEAFELGQAEVREGV
jgi:hypothetical protein